MKKRASVSVLIAVALLAACSATGNPSAPATSAGTGARARAHATYKIYVGNIGSGTITTYEPDGTQTSPTISTGYYLFAIAVAPNGKIYALTFNPLNGPNTSGTITSYLPDGTQTTPTITVKERGYDSPGGLAVDRNGKIYVVSSLHNGSRGTVTTYKADGTQTTPTFRAGADSSSIAVDAHGKIYVTNDTGPHGKSSVTTYLPDGSPTEPIITRGIHQPAGVAVAEDGTILVANMNNQGPNGTGAGFVTSYQADGTGPVHSIKDHRSPDAIAEADGKLYLASTGNTDILKTYTLGGREISPTITAGLYEPSGIAIH